MSFYYFDEYGASCDDAFYLSEPYFSILTIFGNNDDVMFLLIFSKKKNKLEKLILNYHFFFLVSIMKTKCTVHSAHPVFPKTDTPKNQNRKTANRRPFIPHLILSANACLYYRKNKQITQENHAARSPLIKKKRTALNTAHTIFRKTAVHCALCTHHTSQTKPQRCVCTNCQK